MRRFDVLVGVSLALLAGFVGYEALRTRAMLGAARERRASFGTARPDSLDDAPDRPAGHSEIRVITDRTTGRPGPAGDDARRRLELSSGGTYIGEVLAAHDSALARWPERMLEPLRVWVQPTSDLDAFREEFVPVARRAFTRWADVGIPISFTFVVDSARADVHVSWVDEFTEQISGKTIWARDVDWWIVDAQVLLAVRHQSGQPLDTTAVRAIAMHEVGHLLGLDHTSDTTSIMAPRVRVRDLSAADRATLQLLYKLPPGSVKER